MKIKEGFVLTLVGDDYIAVPVGEASESFHGIVRLNDTCAFIWRGIAEGMNIAQIAELMLSEYEGVTPELARKAVAELVENLKKDGLVED